jgi:anaerobic ribonucleoside-triphosphate reductase activating protein
VNKELVFVLEPDCGRVTVEISQASKPTIDALANDLGTRADLNCAKPVQKESSLPILESGSTSALNEDPDAGSIWLYRIYHNSVVDGPGRRSVVQVSGCSIRCAHCIVPETHEIENGTLVSIFDIVSEIRAHRNRHDGVTILGGEPFDQPRALAELVSQMKYQCVDITVFSGYTIEQLIKRREPSIDYVLTHIDLLIDGPFVAARSDASGEYRGSQNQRLILLHPPIRNGAESFQRFESGPCKAAKSLGSIS